MLCPVSWYLKTVWASAPYSSHLIDLELMLQVDGLWQRRRAEVEEMFDVNKPLLGPCVGHLLILGL